MCWSGTFADDLQVCRIARLLTISFTEGEQGLNITVEDNGVGRAQAASNKSQKAITTNQPVFRLRKNGSI